MVGLELFSMVFTISVFIGFVLWFIYNMLNRFIKSKVNKFKDSLNDFEIYNAMKDCNKYTDIRVRIIKEDWFNYLHKEKVDTNCQIKDLNKRVIELEEQLNKLINEE